MPSTDEILKKYGAKIESQLGTYVESEKNYSKDYEQFKQDMIPHTSSYEKWAKSLGNLIKINLSRKDTIKIQKQIDIAHLDITPSQAMTLSVISMLLVFFATLLIAMAVFFINGTVQILFGFLGILASMFIFYYTYTMPQRFANSWRLQASSQMVPTILYVVVYMKHTSNLERAIEFASQHLEGPLALDLKKVFYDVEVGRFSTIKQSLDHYLETWRDYAPEFVESFHLIESSLYEPSDSRRIEILEKSLQVILDGIYEKMLKYTRDIRSPLTNIYMLGIILPTLGLALLPLASTLLGDAVKWPHFVVIFNILVPFAVFYLTTEALLKRPGGYGESSILELNPDYGKYKSSRPWLISGLVSFPLLIIGLLPFLFQMDWLTGLLNLKSDYTLQEIGLGILGNAKIFDFKEVNGSLVGPFGSIAAIFSLFIPLSIAVFFSVAYRLKTKELIKARENTKKLEDEFTNSLFQLGNRLADGIPAEIVFAKVAESTRGQVTQQFFLTVNSNIQQLGMSLDAAIFDKKRGAMIYFPSALISTSMKILVESVKKGLQVAARSLMSISEYVKNINKINQRLHDLLAEIVSDMKSNMTFLAPLLAGIVIGLGSMITLILNKLAVFQEGTTEASSLGSIGSLADITKIFDVSSMIPPYYLQVIVGFYIIEIIFILTIALVTVDSGKDPLKEKYELSKNLRMGVLLYLITAGLSITALSFLANIALGSLT